MAAAAGAPVLVAAGPIGWAILGIAIAVTAYAVYRASRTADTTFPDTVPGCRQPCPAQAEERPEPQARPRPIPIPRAEPERRTKSCATEYPSLVLCSNLPSGYRYPSRQAAFQDIVRQSPGRNLRMEKTRTATRGPCPGVGTHTAVKDGGVYVASIVCCPCCSDTPAGPVQSTRCGIV